MSSFPPLAALFLTHFDDVKGQSTVYYKSVDDQKLPAGQIEHLTLPSGLHQLSTDLVCFTHGSQPAVGLFRSRDLAAGTGRGRRMGTVGVVLESHNYDALFDLKEPLDELYGRLEQLENPFDAAGAGSVLHKVWDTAGSKALTPLQISAGNVYDRVKGLVDGTARVSATHPITYLPTLLQLLGPHLIPVFRASLEGRRILLHSSPPLLPLAAFAWCIWAMGITSEGASADWVGNVGLMDLTDMKSRQGGWVATTSDAIYRSHPKSYDIYIDFTSSLSPSPETSSTASTHDVTVLSTLTPNSEPRDLSYSFSDLPLYRSLLMLDQSPSGVSITGRLSRQGGWWLLAFEVFERFWSLCVGVCEYATGRGRVGHIALKEGEEDARPMGEEDLPIEGADDEGPIAEDEAVRRGRLVLRAFWHQTYHSARHP